MNQAIKTMKPKAIFFDLDETLVENKIDVADLFARMYLDFKEQLGSENQELFFKVLRSQIGPLWNSMFDTGVSPEDRLIDCFTAAIASTGTVDPAKQTLLAQEMLAHYVHLSSNNVVLHDGALKTLATLSERGFITGLITNGIERIQLGKIHQLELHNRVDHVTVSAQARAHKPHAPVFQLALGRAGVEAREAWQIGDHPTNDVAGAMRIGMGGVFFNPKGHAIDDKFSELDERPTHHISHLLEVLEILENDY